MNENLQIGPYTVPEAHIVQASFGLLNKSASEGWIEPEKFDPERFIDGDSGKVSRTHKLIPFSTGKRQCPAETLATSQVGRSNLFQYILTIKAAVGSSMRGTEVKD